MVELRYQSLVPDEQNGMNYQCQVCGPASMNKTLRKVIEGEYKDVIMCEECLTNALTENAVGARGKLQAEGTVLRGARAEISMRATLDIDESRVIIIKGT